MKAQQPVLEVSITGILALIFGFFLAAGPRLNAGGYLGYGVEHEATQVFIDWHSHEIYLEIVFYALFVFLILFLLWRALDWIAATRAQKIQSCATFCAHSKTIIIKKRWFWIGVLLLLCSWVPFWLALWPGIFNYDAHYQYEMLVYAELETHHPLVHTLLLDGLVLFGEHCLGSVNTGVAVYIGLGLVCGALTFSWMLFTMAEEGAGRALLIGSFLFLSINPAFVIWLLSTNKDVFFSYFIVLTALILYRSCRLKNGTFQTLRTGVAVALALFWSSLGLLAFRTSALYSLIIFLPFAFFLVRKHLRARLVGALASATLVFAISYLMCTQIIFQVPSGPWQTLDALSIPRQQLARVWAQLQDPTEIAAFEQVFDSSDLKALTYYEADDADTSRSAFRQPFEDRPLKLLALYLDMGTKYPGTYTDAALLTSYEAWYPGAVADGYVMDDYFAKPGAARSSYIDVSTFWPAQEAWLLPSFGAWLKEFGLGNIGLDFAPLRFLCSPASYMWILLSALARTVSVRNRRGALVCSLLLIFGLTALLSPLVVMRYYLMLMAATPLLLHIMASPRWQKKNDPLLQAEHTS